MWNIIIFLIVVGMLLLVSETFMPGGILGTIGFILVVIGVVMTYREHGTTTGNIVLLVSVLSSFLFVYIGLKIFPHTRLGKMVILADDVSKKNGYDSSISGHASLIGKTGEVLTDLRPAGVAKIEGQRVDVISEGGYISKGERVKVITVEGSRVLVLHDVEVESV